MAANHSERHKRIKKEKEREEERKEVLLLESLPILGSFLEIPPSEKPCFGELTAEPRLLVS